MTVEVRQNGILRRSTSSRERHIHVESIDRLLAIDVDEYPPTVGRRRGYAWVRGQNAFGTPIDFTFRRGRRDLGLGWTARRSNEF